MVSNKWRMEPVEKIGRRGRPVRGGEAVNHAWASLAEVWVEPGP